MGDLDKWIVAKGFKKLPKVQKIAQFGHTELGWHGLGNGISIQVCKWKLDFHTLDVKVCSEIFLDFAAFVGLHISLPNGLS